MIKEFIDRHIGPSGEDMKEMLSKIGVTSLDELTTQTIPDKIRVPEELFESKGITENEYFQLIKELAAKNRIFKSYIGQGYYGTILPAVIQRNILENPAWYTSYTPYQAEISQGRLEALLNFQTVVMELTDMDIANASLLDEANAAAEAMIMMYNSRTKELVNRDANILYVDENIFSQTLDVLKTKCAPFNIIIQTGKYTEYKKNEQVFGFIVQYPAADGKVEDYRGLTSMVHETGAMLCVMADILSLALLTPPGEWGADIVAGSTQRLGIPMGYGGPHAAFFATREAFKRSMPGRIIGVSVDRRGVQALRMALQTREQHIKREKATSNICTAQALLATMAGMYAVYHGGEGLKSIALKIHNIAGQLAEHFSQLGYVQENKEFFDTLLIRIPENIQMSSLSKVAEEHRMNFHYINEKYVGVSIDETTTLEDANLIIEVFAIASRTRYKNIQNISERTFISKQFIRESSFLQLDVFKSYHSETEMMRYIKRLEQKDISLVHSMIPLGSCTMKLNAAIEMIPVSWPEFGNIHPFVPLDQVEGYHELIHELGKYLKKTTGFDAVSFQPNSGASGEYAGLMVIREYHLSKGDKQRNIALIPASAHGTNPASAVAAGMEVVVVPCDKHGNIDKAALQQAAQENKDRLAAFMVTYPSTHGVFEDDIIEMVDIIHQHGGLVYMDGANMNAQLGLTNPSQIGADVCHLNLHKTFAIPHGGGGPGMGPIAVAEHLVEFLPTHPVLETGGLRGITAVSAAPWGSASILPISFAYCKMAGMKGLKKSAEVAILNANYLAVSLNPFFPVLYTNKNGRVAHELIIDLRPIKTTTGISEIDVAKRLMDYGFHAPTVSFPVHGTLMIEPTESESKEELDRFIQAMVSIFNEIKAVESGKFDKEDNPLKNAPHTVFELSSNEWNHSYSRELAAFPLKWLVEKKFWPSVSRVNDAHGDRNLVCSCRSIDEFRKSLYQE